MSEIEAMSELGKYFLWFLEEMRTKYFAVEIFWPLLETHEKSIAMLFIRFGVFKEGPIFQ